MAELSEPEAKKLLGYFQEINLKPKVDSLDDFKASMEGHYGQGEERKETPPVPSMTDFKHHFPKLTNFSGDNKKDVGYDIWRSEVKFIARQGYSSQIVGHAIRSSLSGDALRAWARLGPGASVDVILEKMDSVYGDVQQSEMILAKFYSSKQESDEDVSMWSCKLEDLLAKAVEAGEVQSTKVESMLRTMFLTGLRPSLKDPTGHLFESIHDFDHLRVAIRRVEEDRRSRQPDSSKKKPETAKSATNVPASSESEMTQLRGMIQQLSTDLQSLKNQQQYGNQSYRGKQGNQNFDRGSNRQRGGNRNQSQRYQNFQPQQDNVSVHHDTADDAEPVCFRCGREGHIAIGCRAKVGVKLPLNSNKPASKGGR